MNKLTLRQKLRAGHVKRWQIVRVAREQTIAEHMYKVNLIANELSMRIGLPETQLAYVNEWALIHDLPEVIMGDIATPTKAGIYRVTGNADVIKSIEYSVDDQYKNLHQFIEKNYPVVLTIVKISDLIEAVEFLAVEGMGKHAMAVKDILSNSIREQTKLAALGYPEYDWDRVQEIAKEVIDA
jgi:5'-deoxynucleotidase YfbR-like HD superfamily hydrolase